MYVSDLIEDFLEYLEVERGRSPKTIENYRFYLERFDMLSSEILNHSLEPKDIDLEFMRKYRIRLNREVSDKNNQRLATITQAYHLIAVRGFLKYLARRSIKSLDHSLIDLPKVTRKQVTFLHYDEVERLLEVIPEDTESFVSFVTPVIIRKRIEPELILSFS